MTWSDLQPFATAIAGAAAVAAFILTVLRERHPLTAVERLTTISTSMKSPAMRELVERHRDEQATQWVLEQRAPAEVALRWAGRALRVMAGIAFLVWIVGMWLTPSLWWFWLAYGATIILFIAGNTMLHLRQLRRAAWMQQERSWTGIPQPETAQRVAPN